jgi:subtilisin family serine protease
VLDTGFDLYHPDLEPNINLNLSADMTGEGLQYTLPDAYSHGTHTAGTIAAADNGLGVIGVAPEAELVLVKVLFDDGWGFDSDVLNGMIHAVNVDADIISMSLGGSFFKSGEKPYYTAKDAAEFKNIYDRVVHYARVNGSIVIAAAGNDGADFDHTADLLFVPACAVNVVSVSATGPNGWALDPTTNLDLPAYYTNFGQSVIDFAGPGGTVDFDLAFSGAMATVAGITRPAYVFDFVFSTGNNAYFWSIGTSMATPHVAGVAALIVGKNGGSMDPVKVEAILRASADDLGKPGKDDFYGSGRVNAFRAVSQ